MSAEITVDGGVLSDNKAKLDKIEKSIQAALKRKRKIIEESKLYAYDRLSELYGGMEGQALLDAVTAEHTLIGKLTASGMSHADIESLADSSDDDTDNGSNNADDEASGQTSFFEHNSYSD